MDVAPFFLLIALAAAPLTGCALSRDRLSGREELVTPAGQLLVEYLDVPPADRHLIQASLERVAGELTRWGALREPVRLHVLPSHQRLEEAVDRRGYADLRAWARYDEIHLQSPSTWSLLGTTPAAVEELLLHELTHCVMYQRAATRTSWSRKEIPLWFREGMASYSTGQAHRWPAPEELARFLARHPEAAPLASPERLLPEWSDIVYGASHHAFTFLVRHHGEEAIRRLLEAMGEGKTFPPAFTETLGLSPEAFAADFMRHLRENTLEPRSIGR